VPFYITISFFNLCVELAKTKRKFKRPADRVIGIGYYAKISASGKPYVKSLVEGTASPKCVAILYDKGKDINIIHTQVARPYFTFAGLGYVKV